MIAPRLTVLGSAGSHPGPGRMCSSYLLEMDGTRILFDMGNGSTANLQRYCAVDELDAVVLTHRHIDHCIDLVSSFYGLREQLLGQGRRIAVYAADEVVGFTKSLLSRDSSLLFDEVYDARTVEAGDTVEVGPVRMDLHHSIHPVPTLSVRCQIEDRVFVYSSDSAGGTPLLDAARGADLFLCEATWATLDDFPPGLHLDGEGAGRLAKQAGVGRLLVTHVAPGSDRQRIAEDAAMAYGQDVRLVDDLDEFDL